MTDNLLYFCIIGREDIPIYEIELLSTGGKKEDLNQFIIHSALDMVERMEWTKPTMFLKEVDRFNKLTISAFVTAGYVKLLMLHSRMEEQSIKNFFIEAYQLYMKMILNPFFDYHKSLSSSNAFDSAVKKLAIKYF